MSELFKDKGPFATIITDVDREHARLHDEAKRVAMLVARSEDKMGMVNAVLDFTAGMEAHFRHEETFFGSLPSHRAEAHRNEHEMLILSLKLFANSIQDSDGMKNWKHFTGLEDLLLKHIILFDLEMRPEPGGDEP